MDTGLWKDIFRQGPSKDQKVGWWMKGWILWLWIPGPLVLDSMLPMPWPTQIFYIKHVSLGRRTWYKLSTYFHLMMTDYNTHTYIYIQIYTYIYIYRYIHIYIYCVYVNMCVLMCISRYCCIYIYMYICTLLWLCIHVFVYTLFWKKYIYIYIYHCVGLGMKVIIGRHKFISSNVWVPMCRVLHRNVWRRTQGAKAWHWMSSHDFMLSSSQGLYQGPSTMTNYVGPWDPWF